MPCKSFLSRKNSLPGPHVGKVAKEQTILPPVAASDEMAASRVGKSVGSGFLAREKRLGSARSRDTMTGLVISNRPDMLGTSGLLRFLGIHVKSITT